MNLQSLHSQLDLGEAFTRLFKADVKNAESLASDMAAFANTGGMVLSGQVDLIRDLINVEPAA